MPKIVEPVRNAGGETLDEVEARFLKERVTRKFAVLYALSLSESFEREQDIHHAAFYRTVARLLVAHDDS